MFLYLFSFSAFPQLPAATGFVCEFICEFFCEFVCEFFCEKRNGFSSKTGGDRSKQVILIGL